MLKVLLGETITGLLKLKAALSGESVPPSHWHVMLASAGRTAFSS